MKIKINEDTFDIVKRIKEIDENYYVVYDTQKGRFEMHYDGLQNTFCFVIGDELDNRAIDLIYYTSIKYIDELFDEVDSINQKIENESTQRIRSDADYMLREIYKFSSCSTKKLDNAFQSKWR